MDVDVRRAQDHGTGGQEACSDVLFRNVLRAAIQCPRTAVYTTSGCHKANRATTSDPKGEPCFYVSSSNDRASG